MSQDGVEVENRDIVVEARTATKGGVAISYGARVQSQTERMFRRRQITDRQFQAGERLRKSYLLGVAGARDFDAAGCSSYSPSGYSDAQLDALRDYRRARDAVGARLWPLTFAVIIEDFTVDRWRNDRAIKEDPKGVMALFRHALDVLADHFRL